ncbi:hypothetical protein PQ455_15725 [Sphingomonas naphthae]|uniref:Uncharacterized protein n=1 Tax=Sphingomonas naphthae TaxID=1813468 RepID=A0ABY7TK22_9SPHN|nr:hypothetical protein [Sphingomonas naphthae]WCT73062.1 hypothetical protein PQ455_15725 [Sphingomonas naphthae]
MPTEPQRITFRNDGRDIAGHRRLPDSVEERRAYPAAVVAGPGSRVEEQARHPRAAAGRARLGDARENGPCGSSLDMTKPTMTQPDQKRSMS